MKVKAIQGFLRGSQNQISDPGKDHMTVFGHSLADSRNGGFSVGEAVGRQAIADGAAGVANLRNV
jgi:hypothetical protein